MNIQQLQKQLQQLHLRNIHAVTVRPRQFVVSAGRCKMTIRNDGVVKKLVDFKHKRIYLNEEVNHTERDEKFTVLCGIYSLSRFVDICNKSEN